MNILVSTALVRLRLIPHPSEFYDLFVRAGENALDAARHAETRFREYPNSTVSQEEVKAIETAGDQITRDLIQLLNTEVPSPVGSCCRRECRSGAGRAWAAMR